VGKFKVSPCIVHVVGVIVSVMKKTGTAVDRTMIQVSCSPAWRDHVQKVAKDRGVTMSHMIRELVDDGIEEIGHIAAMVADPVLMQGMKSMFSNAEVIGAMLKAFGEKHIDDTQLRLFEDGMKAFQQVVRKDPAPKRKRKK
jgi:hypothetical protein